MENSQVNFHEIFIGESFKAIRVMAAEISMDNGFITPHNKSNKFSLIDFDGKLVRCKRILKNQLFWLIDFFLIDFHWFLNLSLQFCKLSADFCYFLIFWFFTIWFRKIDPIDHHKFDFKLNFLSPILIENRSIKIKLSSLAFVTGRYEPIFCQYLSNHYLDCFKTFTNEFLVKFDIRSIHLFDLIT